MVAKVLARQDVARIGRQRIVKRQESVGDHAADHADPTIRVVGVKMTTAATQSNSDPIAYSEPDHGAQPPNLSGSYSHRVGPDTETGVKDDVDCLQKPEVRGPSIDDDRRSRTDAVFRDD